MNFHKRLHALSHYKPVYKLVSAGKRIVLPGFDGLPLFEVVSFFIKRLEEGEIQTRARSLAFSFLLALFPGIIFIFTVIPYIPIDSFQDRLLELIRNFLPASTFELAHETIEDIVRHQHGGLLSFGFVFALYVTTDGIIALMNWFNKSFHGKRERAGWKQRLIALGITLFLSLLIFIAIGLGISSEFLFYYLESKGVLVNLMQLILITAGKWVILLALCFTAISVLYYFGPSKRERIRFISAGSSLATMLFVITTLGFNYFITHFGQYNKLYGSIGTLIIILLWLYINSLVLLVGYELNVSIRKARKITQFPIP
ncbi:MAG: YihY/virulence factor BrkB family protein [Sphingobacteriales bacterium]|jgi:membrane protein|nr:YihY/virulence factor BrkB family protein [Sphingobacteriales bacterium]